MQIENCKLKSDRRGITTLIRLVLQFAVFNLQFALFNSPAFCQPQAPQYEECRLDSIFPNGAQRGTTVKVEVKGFGSGLTGPKQILIDGPTGIEVRELKSVNGGTLEASLEIAPDAPPGRRWLRVLNERSGLTNFAHFVVGTLPEVLEVEPNNDDLKAQSVTTPAVINGRINPQADIDVFKFSGKANQKVIAAVAAHALDVHGQYKNYGIADFSLELLDAGGRTLAAAEDSVGFDPIVEHTLPADGEYIVRVQLLTYGGFPEAVYRLTLGDVPYPVSAFPAGFQRGTEPPIELVGLTTPAGSVNVGQPSQAVVTLTNSNSRLENPAAYDPAYPVRYLVLPDKPSSGLDVPVIVGDFPEVIEVEPNNDSGTAQLLSWPVTTNGRFLQPGDADWFKVRLDAGQKVWFETIAHRFVRSPVDTLIQVYDSNGKLLVDNDDESFDPGYECYQDYRTTDSKVLFAAPAAGDFLVKVSDQNGVNGARAIYRLTIQEARPDFRVTHFPDAVPIWGPGTTACVMARVDRFAECQDDIELFVTGLPEGWTTRSATSLGRIPQRYYNNHQNKVFLTITAPPDAEVGTCLPFRIVGRTRPKPVDPATSPASVIQPGKGEEHLSLPLNLFYTSDTGFFRASPVSRIAVAKSQGPWLEAITQDLTLSPGGAATLDVRVHGAGDLKEMPVVVSLATNGVACGLTTPQNIAIKDGIVSVPLKLPAEMPIGDFGITVAQTWRNDIRIGMPGPCTALMRLTVIPAK